MTEKRFTVIDWGIGMQITDHQKNKEYSNLDDICEELNALHEENEQLRKDREDLFYRERDTKNEWRELKQENEQLKKAEILANHRGEMIGFANSLIDDLGGETMKEMWDKFKNGKYEKWCELE